MKILQPDKDLENKIQENIATPYFKHSKEGLEIGYCIIDKSNCIKEKTIIISHDINEMLFKSYDEIYTPIFLSKTHDGSFRCWTDNFNFYLVWNIENKIIILEPRRRKRNEYED